MSCLRHVLGNSFSPHTRALCKVLGERVRRVKEMPAKGNCEEEYPDMGTLHIYHSYARGCHVCVSWLNMVGAAESEATQMTVVSPRTQRPLLMHLSIPPVGILIVERHYYYMVICPGYEQACMQRGGAAV